MYVKFCKWVSYHDCLEQFSSFTVIDGYQLLFIIWVNELKK